MSATGMTDASGRVDNSVRQRTDESIGFLRTLIALGKQGEAAVQAHVAAALAEAGCVVEHLCYRPADVSVRDEFASSGAMDAEQRVSIVARLKGTGGGRSVIFFAHPDSEPLRNIESWTHEPFAGTIQNGRIHGWGVADDLAGVAGFVEAVRAVVGAGLRPRGDVILASTPSKRHARGVFHVLQSGFSADAAVYMHPAESGVGMREIKAVASGIVLFKVTVTGCLPNTNEPSHTAFAHRAVNPLDKALVLIGALRALDAERGLRVRHQVIEKAVGRATNLLVANLACGHESEHARLAPECSFGASLSFPPGERMIDVQAEITAALKASCEADPWLALHPPKIEWVSGVTGAELPENHPLYAIVAAAVTEVTGSEPFVNPLHTSSDIRVPMVQVGIPTVGLGPLGGNLTQNGCQDEWVDVADYIRSIQVAALVIADWCGVTDA
jgi:acetylornithine deacetylase